MKLFFKQLASAIEEGTTLFEPIERPITCVSALYDARQASWKEKNILVGSFPELRDRRQN
jgi:hypothetical protein